MKKMTIEMDGPKAAFVWPDPPKELNQLVTFPYPFNSMMVVSRARGRRNADYMVL